MRCATSTERAGQHRPRRSIFDIFDMPSKPKYTTQQMIDALLATGGIISLAAKRIGCSRHTVHIFIKNHPTVKAAYDEANEANLDIAEAMLLQQVRAGNEGQLRFYLSAKGRSRGYGASQGTKEDPHTVVIQFVDP